jgi:hypothetical protein
MAKFLNEKAQASAPFELFVAVIIMAFVVVVGYTMLERVNDEVCLNSVDKEMTKFKTNLEETVSRKSTKQFTFTPQDRCFSSKSTTMKIELERKRDTCAARCNYPSDQCYVMTYYNPNISEAFRQKCLDLPPLTTFLTGSCPIEGTGDIGYTAIDPTNPADSNRIDKGSYITKNISPAGETYPRICVYYKS